MNADKLKECIRRGAASGVYDSLTFGEWHNGNACPMWVAALGALNTDRAGIEAEWYRWLRDDWEVRTPFARAGREPQEVFVAHVLGVTPDFVDSYVEAWDSKWEMAIHDDEDAQPDLTVDSALAVLDIVLAQYAGPGDDSWTQPEAPEEPPQ